MIQENKFKLRQITLKPFFLFYFLFLLLFSNHLFSQEWSYTDSYSSFPSSVIEDDNQNLLIVGFAFMTNNEKHASLIKLNSDGEFQWINFYGISDSDRAYSITTTSSGYLIYGYNNQLKALIIIKTDFSGNSQWIQSISNYYINVQKSIVTDNEGNIYLSACDISLPGTKPAVIKLDSFGNQIWSKTYEDPNATGGYGRYIFKTDNNELLFINSNDFEFSDGTQKKYEVFRKIDTAGIVLKELVIENFRFGALAVDYISEDLLIVTDLKDEACDPRILKLDLLNESIVFNKPFQDQTWLVKDITTGSNGNFIVSGSEWTSSTDYDAVIWGFDGNGVLTTKNRFDFGSYENSKSIIQVSDGGLVSTGIINFSGPERNILVFKVGADQLTSTQSVIPQDKKILIYPNPNKGQFLLDYMNSKKGIISIYNPLGKLIYKQEITAHSSREINLSALPKGLYHLTVFDEEKKTITEKIVVD